MNTALPTPDPFELHANEEIQNDPGSNELDRFFAITPDLFSVTDLDGRLIRVSASWTKLFGRTREQLLTMNILDLVHPEDREPTMQALSVLVHQESVSGFVNRCIRSDGSECCIEWHADPYGDRIYSSGRDVTNRMRRDAALKQDALLKEKLVQLLQTPFTGADKFLDETLRLVIDFTDSAYGFIMNYSEETQLFSLHSWSIEVMEQCRVSIPLGLQPLSGSGLWSEAVRRREPIIINDLAATELQGRGIPMGHVPIHRFASVPVFSDGAIIAIVGVANKKLPYADKDILNLKLLMNTVWPVVERARLVERLGEMAIKDSLTNLYNRRFLDNWLPGEIQRSERHAHPISMIMVDIDHFKVINDAYGHPRGDRVLVTLADIMRRSVREGDMIVRIGGEEFLILLPECSLRSAEILAERARKHISEHVAADAVTFTASLGVTCHHAGETFDSWYRRTDAALYVAKNLGRNRVASG